MAYYQGSSYAQPVYVPSIDHSHHGRRHRRGHHHSYQPSVEEYYPQQPVTYAPTHSTSSRRHGRHHSTPVVVAPSAPVVTQPTYSSHGHHHRHQHHSGGGHYYRTFGDRLRHFFGLAPSANYRYKSDRSSWGFMGYSRRPRYMDARTGAEVDRKGRPVYRV